MVPECQEASMAYEFLKSLVKEIHLFKQRKGTSPLISRNRALYRAFSGLKQRGLTSASDIENQEIIVNNMRRHGEDECSETMFLMAADEGGEYEMVYFKKLDDEFNKVVNFYKVKVEEVIKEAEALNKQMEALIAFRVKVENPKGWINSLEEIKLHRLQLLQLL